MDMSSFAGALNSTNVRNMTVLAWERLNLAVSTWVAPQRAVDRAARLFATPPRFAHTVPERALLATGRGFVVASGEGRIAAWRFGEESHPAVILSHGWGGRGAQLRAFVPALVEAGYQAILFDHPGHGHSEGREASLVHFVKGIDAVARDLEARGAKVAGIVAHSLGAAAATAWLNQTRRELRVVLIAAPTSLERYSGYFARRLGMSESIRQAMQQRFERRFGHRWDEFELPQSVSRVNAAALVIHDANDRDVSAASGLALARAWRGARFLMTHGLGHRRILRDASVVADAVDFLADRVQFAPPPRPGEALAYVAPAPLL
jgi:pimeloyl-ACP methyl ester carboxylesterase